MFKSRTQTPEQKLESDAWNTVKTLNGLPSNNFGSTKEVSDKYDAAFKLFSDSIRSGMALDQVINACTVKG